jgi:4-diphosphocytidyl-2-C-methyl-D-erythritol kinase
VIREPAFAKLNLVLHVGRKRPDGLHPLCSVFASLELADTVEVETTEAGCDSVDCPGVPGPNLAAEAVTAFRARVPSLPSLRIRIDKRIPVAAGLGGGSADAAAALRAANRIAGQPRTTEELRVLAAALGSDVPSQNEPGHALVSGVGEIVEPVRLPPYPVVLVPQARGLSTPDVYAQLDRTDGGRERLDPEPLRDFIRSPDPAAVENDLQPAAIALRPELTGVLDELRAQGALAVLVSGSGPTCFGLFADSDGARRAGRQIDGAIVTALRRA